VSLTEKTVDTTIGKKKKAIQSLENEGRSLGEGTLKRKDKRPKKKKTFQKAFARGRMTDQPTRSKTFEWGTGPRVSLWNARRYQI